jgi:hypothetical protein
LSKRADVPRLRPVDSGFWQTQSCDALADMPPATAGSGFFGSCRYHGLLPHHLGELAMSWEEKRKHKRFPVDQKSTCGLPDGEHYVFRLSNISHGGAYLRFVDGESDRWVISSAGLLANEIVELTFTMMIGRKLLPESLICRVLGVTSQGIRLAFITHPSAGLGALRTLCDRHSEVRLSRVGDPALPSGEIGHTRGKALFLID